MKQNLHLQHSFSVATLIVITMLIVLSPLTASASTLCPATKTVDFDGDGRTNVTLFESNAGLWHTYDFYTGIIGQHLFGSSGDRQVAGNYDGDLYSDFATSYDDVTSGIKMWNISYSSSEPGFDIPWGIVGDIPVPADYDGDCRTDLAVFRPSTATWLILLSDSATAKVEQFGASSDRLAPADYDGDGLIDIAVMRPANSTWYVRYSDGSGDDEIQWDPITTDEDIIVTADYDGDHKDDLAVYQVDNGFWTILESISSTYRTAQFGDGTYSGNSTPETASGSNIDMPMPGDFDGDGIIDIAVWNRKTKTVNVLPSQSSILTSLPVGNDGSQPVSLSVIYQNQ